MKIIENNYDKKVVYFNIRGDGVCYSSQEIKCSLLKKVMIQRKIKDPFTAAAELFNEIEISENDYILPSTPLAELSLKGHYLDTNKHAVSIAKIIKFFEGKEYRVEKKEALITLTIFLSRKIKPHFLGVCMTVNQLAVVMKMSTRRISNTITQLTDLKLVTLKTRKVDGVSIASVVMINNDFFLKFFDGFDSENIKQKIQTIKFKKKDPSNENKLISYNVDDYFSYAEYLYGLKNKLLELVREENTHEQVKEHLYLLLSHR